MKQVIVILCLQFLSPAIQAQSGINNLSFENWGSTIFGPSPLGWFGTALAQQTGGAQHGNKYARVSGTSPSPNMTGFMFLGALVGNTAISFVPYTQRPVTLNGFYRCGGLGSGDSVGIVSLLKKNGNLLNYDYAFFKNNTANWTSFSIGYQYFDNQIPDSVSIMVLSNPLMMGGGQNTTGAYIEVDNLSFNLGTDIDEFSIGTGFLVYPNPASETLNIMSKVSEAKYINISQVNGSCVEQLQIDSELTQLSLKSYSAGFYLYNICDEKGLRLFTGKFFVSH